MDMDIILPDEKYIPSEKDLDKLNNPASTSQEKGASPEVLKVLGK